MTHLTTLDLNKLTPFAVGFDRIFDDMNRYMTHQATSTAFPPYNIIKDGNKFQIEMALAGVKKEDLKLEIADGVLTVEHNPENVVENDKWEWLHKGISQRKFRRKFTLADDIVVNSAEMTNGMLYVELERIIPEEKKPKLIEIK
jgi:molecular chaperone IbpA